MIKPFLKIIYSEYKGVILMEKDEKKLEVNHEAIKDFHANGDIVNEDKFNVEVAKDFTVPIIASQLINAYQPLTGYTAGLITRDLVTKGEEMAVNKYNNEKELKK